MSSRGEGRGLSSECARLPRLRVAIVATPRSGNTWLKGLLTSLYGLPDIICDVPDEVPWQTLPERCVLQLHWGPEPGLLASFRDHEIRPVTIARHPLDTLISVLHFCTTWHKTARWYGGRGGDEDSVRGVLPSSTAFLSYATGSRAATLMSISREWLGIPTCHGLCYEQLVDDPHAELERLSHFLEVLPAEAIESAVAGNSLEQTRPKVANQHHWVGTSAHWKRLLTASAARQIAAAHSATMELFHYESDADEALTVTQADLNWFALEIQSLRQELGRTRKQLLEAGERLDDAEACLLKVRRVAKPLKPLRELGRQSARLAQQLRAYAGRNPHLSAALAQLVRPFARKAG
jgi:hypothetical protein